MKHLFLALCILAFPSAAATQSVTINPTTLTFSSADHSAVVGDVALVTNYIVDYYQGATLVSTVNIGKPAGAGDTISVPLVSGLSKNTVYTLYVTAVGPGGAATSVSSAPFCMARGSKGCQ